MNSKHCFQFCTRVIVGGLSFATLLPVTVQAQTVSWTRQLGTPSSDSSTGIATDSKGNVYISGYTEGSLGRANQREADAWVAKYSSNGSLMWKKQLGTGSEDRASSVAINSKGNIYVSGSTLGSLGEANQGKIDAWVAKYSSNGSLVWKKQLGTSSDDFSDGVATDSKGNIYISGYTEGSLEGTNQGAYDAWVAKYSSNSTLVWKRQLGTSSDDYSYGVATDSIGDVYISGVTFGSLGGVFQGGFSDAWVAKYSSNGSLVWKKQLGNFDISNGVATDSKGNVYISGATFGSLGGANQRLTDAWLAKYNFNGSLVWKKQLGTSDDDSSYGVATDNKGNVYISGLTAGSLGGANQGSGDAWLAKYSSNGSLVWKRQFGSRLDEASSSVATDSIGNVYISGNKSDVPENRDAWVVKYTQ